MGNPVRRAEKSQHVFTHFLQLPEVHHAHTICLYVGVHNEVHTIPLIEKLLIQKKCVVVPVTDFANKRLHLSELHSLTDLIETKQGLLEVLPEKIIPVRPEAIEVIVVPGVAFDEKGNRLGRGAGHYDRLLPQLKKEALRVGFCFEENLEKKVPTEAHDVPMHCIVTERRAIRCT